MKKYYLGIVLMIVTAGLVGMGAASSAGKLHVVYMAAGASVASSAPAPDPVTAVRNLYENVQRRTFDIAYSYVANTQDVDKATFVRDVFGTDGNLRSYSALSDFQVNQLSKEGDHAKVRASLQWATAVGEYDETKDFDLVRSGNSWKLVWQSEKQASVPPQVVPVTYPRWDVIRQTESAVAPSPKVQVVSQALLNDADNLVLIGELQNQDSEPSAVSIRARLVSGDGTVLAEESTFENIRHTLLPGEKTPFRIDFERIPRSKVEKVKLDVSSTLVSATADPQVSISKLRLDDGDAGARTLHAEALNQSGKMVNIPQVLAAFYDAGGKLVWVEGKYLDRSLLPQTPLEFAVNIPAGVAAQVKDSRVVVNSYRQD